MALPLGIYAASRPGRAGDLAINLAAFAGISMPPFWLAILLIILFAVPLGASCRRAAWAMAELGDRLRHLVLPVLTLAIVSVGGLLRYVRAGDARGDRPGFHPHRARQGRRPDFACSSATRSATR